MIIIVLSVILLIISGISKAICDVSAINGSIDKLSKLNMFWWRKSISANNKYKDRDKNKGEAFIGSTTIFVIFTDAWHLFDFIRDLSLILALLITPSLWIFIGAIPIKQIAFEITFKYLRKV